jgi:hypothetical protein
VSARLPPNAAVTDVLATLARPTDYLRGMLANLYECKRQRGSARARIGITGDGIAPHYRIDFSFQENSLGFKHGIFGAFDGRSHKLIAWIDEASQDDGSVLVSGHWSTRAMTVEEVANILGQIGNFKKGSKPHP